VYVVWHQAVSENADAGLTAVFSEQIEVDTPVSFGLVGCGRRLGSRFRVGSRVGEIRAGRAGLSVAYFAVVVWWENFFQRFCGRGRSVCPTPCPTPQPTTASVYASTLTSRWPLQDSRSEWSRFSFHVGCFHRLQHAGLSRRSADRTPSFPQLL
jgi:hypothetical protein